MESNPNQPGWYPQPGESSNQQYWNGEEWKEIRKKKNSVDDNSSKYKPGTFSFAVYQGLTKAFDFKGVSTRSDYWFFFLFNYLAIFVAIVISLPFGKFGSFLIGIGYLYLVICNLSNGIRRMHDAGHSGFFILLPVVNLIFALSPTVKVNNKYIGSDNE